AMATAQKRPEHIQRHGMLPDRHVDVGDRRILRDRAPGAIVQDIERAIASDGLLYRVFDALLLRHVHFDKARLAASVAHFLLAGAAQLGLEFSEHDLGTLVRKQPGRGPCDPRTGASDEGYLSL